MSDLYNQIVSQRGSVESLLARIPGFRGYMDKAARRTADRMVRDHIADQLRQRIDRLAQIERNLLDGGGLGYMSKTQSAKTKLQTFHDRVKAAAPGYSGFMEAVKVEADDLERIYAFDEALVRYADRFAEALEALDSAVTANEEVASAISVLDRLTIEANEAFSLREDVLVNISKSISG
ncbi:MAG: hypothetical protein L6Q98_06185 [Anaerolineae bacterium]|nr:hypothetical protein [Anaerolineae bacterium]NUQ02772.1 hypothetical protein [Anaerolineae bacterium]